MSNKGNNEVNIIKPRKTKGVKQRKRLQVLSPRKTPFEMQFYLKHNTVEPRHFTAISFFDCLAVHTFSCKKTLLNTTNFFGPMVTVSTGFHCGTVSFTFKTFLKIMGIALADRKKEGFDYHVPSYKAKKSVTFGCHIEVLLLALL